MIYLTDMSKCTPQSALSTTASSGHWRLVEYGSAQMNGTMILAGPLTEAPDVTCPLNVKGWHAIHVGYWPPHLNCVELAAIKVRLKSDPCFVTISDDQMDGLDIVTMREVFWKAADLTGEDIVFGQQIKGKPCPGAVAYLKLEPLSDSQVQAIQADRADGSTRTIVGSNDGGFVGWKDATTEQDICEQVELYRHSDVGRIDWSVSSGDLTKYPSKIGANLHEHSLQARFRAYDRTYVQNLRTLIGKGLVPHKVAMKHAHSIGMQFYYMFRMGMGTMPPPMDRCKEDGTFYNAHPEFRAVSRDGAPLTKLSYAFPEVRGRVLDIMREVLDDEVDGINICWIRGMPSIGYEEPVVEEFRRRHGVDVRTVPPEDERYYRMRADYITGFMRQIRGVTNEVAERRGRPMEITAMVTGSTLDSTLRAGYDLRTWVQEKLVDEMMASATLTRYLQANGVREVIYAAPSGPQEYRDKATMYMETGADGIFVWDMNGKHDLAHHWGWIRRLGHPAEIVDAETSGLLPIVKRLPLKTIGGIDVEHTEQWGNTRALTFYVSG